MDNLSHLKDLRYSLLLRVGEIVDTENVIQFCSGQPLDFFFKLATVNQILMTVV